MIFVTGATGFIGSHVVHTLAARGYPLRVALRRPQAVATLPSGVEGVVVGDLQGRVEWSAPLRGADTVIHLAGRAHVLREADSLAESLCQAVNVAATAALADAAGASGVRRFVFISSSKVLGEETRPGVVWTEDTPPAPQDAYGRSKLAAEQALGEVSRDTGIEVVILRPPVVYGPGVRANIFELFRLVDRGVPLPLGLVQNRRSFVFVGNLVDAIIHVVGAPSAAGQVFHVCDGVPVSTTTLVSAIGRALDRPVRLLPVPPGLLRLAGRAGDMVERLTRIGLPVNSENVTRLVASLVLDDAKLRSVLDWRPQATMDAGLAATAKWYRVVRAGIANGAPGRRASMQ